MIGFPLAPSTNDVGCIAFGCLRAAIPGGLPSSGSARYPLWFLPGLGNGHELFLFVKFERSAKCCIHVKLQAYTCLKSSHRRCGMCTGSRFLLVVNTLSRWIAYGWRRFNSPYDYLLLHSHVSGNTDRIEVPHHHCPHRVGTTEDDAPRQPKSIHRGLPREGSRMQSTRRFIAVQICLPIYGFSLLCTHTWKVRTLVLFVVSERFEKRKAA